MEPSKIVVRYRDGRIVRGFTQNFFPNKPSFHVRPHDARRETDLVEVFLQELKAVFFVRDFFGNPAYKEKKAVTESGRPKGRLLRVTCTDGEVIVGTTTGYDPKRPGFFIFPLDAGWNNIKAYIVSGAVRDVQYL